MISKISIRTRVGWISVFEKEGKIFKIIFGRLKNQIKSKILDNFKKNLFKFFNKKTLYIRAPHRMDGNKVQIKVWNDLKKIKLGNTKSYGQIAQKYKLSPRHVGKICAQNKIPLAIPCHRVIRSDGTMGGFSSSGGIILKKKLLNFENSWKQ